MAYKNDPQKNDVRQGVDLRQEVARLVAHAMERAHKLATSIKHPWYRCQALATVAEYASGTELSAILRESFKSAMMCHDENRRVEAACWPLRVAIQREKSDLAGEFLDGCIGQLKMDRDPISRWSAASVLHTIKTNSALLHAFFDAFQSATSKGHGWRVERRIENLINDIDVQKDRRYIDHLRLRREEIENWKEEHSDKGL